MMLPPLPPSPPSGPPLGTYFSRRKETHPIPPSPAFTSITASSTNMGECRREESAKRESYREVHRLAAMDVRPTMHATRVGNQVSHVPSPQVLDFISLIN